MQESLLYGTKEEVELLLNDTRIDPLETFVIIASWLVFESTNFPKLPESFESFVEINLFDFAIMQQAPLFSIKLLCDHKKVREHQREVRDNFFISPASHLLQIPPLFAACCETTVNADMIQKLLEDPEIDVNEKFMGVSSFAMRFCWLSISGLLATWRYA